MAESRTTIDLDIPHSAEEREARRLAAWDRWYETLPADLRRKLSLHDFKRLGDCFQQAFAINEILPPPNAETVRAALLARTRGDPP
jgi:hypothetical protein